MKNIFFEGVREEEKKSLKKNTKNEKGEFLRGGVFFFFF